MVNWFYGIRTCLTRCLRKLPLLLAGCLNGGGQIKLKRGESAKELIQSLEAKYMEDVSIIYDLCSDLVFLSVV